MLSIFLYFINEVSIRCGLFINRDSRGISTISNKNLFPDSPNFLNFTFNLSILGNEGLVDQVKMCLKGKLKVFE